VLLAQMTSVRVDGRCLQVVVGDRTYELLAPAGRDRSVANEADLWEHALLQARLQARSTAAGAAAPSGCAQSHAGRVVPLPEAEAPPPRQESSSAADPEALLREDAAHAAAEAAKPLPEGSEWHFCGGEELEEPLACTTLIDAAWLLMFALGEVMPERAGVVPAWQDVPPEAVVRLEDLRHTTMQLFLPIAVLSYGWAARHQ
jgi:hypothetical protein